MKQSTPNADLLSACNKCCAVMRLCSYAVMRLLRFVPITVCKMVISA